MNKGHWKKRLNTTSSNFKNSQTTWMDSDSMQATLQNDFPFSFTTTPLYKHTTTSHSPLASPQAQVYDLPSGGLVQVKGPCRPRSGPGLFGQGMQQACIYRGEWYESRCIANGQTCFFHPTGFSMERSTAGCGGVGLLKHRVWGRDPDCRV